MNRPIALSLITIVLTAVSQGQSLNIDWENRKAGACPTAVPSGGRLVVNISGVNDIIYTYDVQTQVVKSYPNDALAAGLFAPESKTASGKDCQAKIARANAALKNYQAAFDAQPALKPAKDLKTKKYVSRKLRETQEAWQKLTAAGSDYQNFLALVADLEKGVCATIGDLKESIDSLRKAASQLKELDARVGGDHTISRVVPLFAGADNDLTITINEEIPSGPDQGTVVDSKTFTCSLKSDVMFLSMGPLFSSVPNRRYFPETAYPTLAPTTPGGSPTTGPGYKSLSVEGGHGVPVTGAALLNYKLPIPGLEDSPFQLAWSAGPTFRFAGQSTSASRIGFFTGLSVSLWRRLYLTPGIHWSQFADYPTSLAPRSFIPDSYPDAQLQGVNRGTVKFGIALSFKTNSFDKLDIGLRKPPAAVTTNTPAPSTESPKPPAAESPKPPAAESPKPPVADPPKPSKETVANTPDPAKAVDDFGKEFGKKPGTAAPSPPAKEQPKTDETTKPAVELAAPVAATLASSATFDGSACPVGGPKPTYATAPDQSAFSVIWTDFVTTSTKSADCQVRVAVKIPAGYQVALLGADYRGARELAKGDRMTVSVQQSMIGKSGSTLAVHDTVEWTGPKSGPVRIRPVAVSPKWSACGEDVTLVFRVQLGLTTTGTSALAQVDSLDFNLGNDDHFSLRACGTKGRP